MKVCDPVEAGVREVDLSEEGRSGEVGVSKHRVTELHVVSKRGSVKIDVEDFRSATRSLVQLRQELIKIGSVEVSSSRLDGAVGENARPVWSGCGWLRRFHVWGLASVPLPCGDCDQPASLRRS
jgi:hypothetical protein